MRGKSFFASRPKPSAVSDAGFVPASEILPMDRVEIDAGAHLESGTQIIIGEQEVYKHTAVVQRGADIADYISFVGTDACRYSGCFLADGSCAWVHIQEAGEGSLFRIPACRDEAHKREQLEKFGRQHRPWLMRMVGLPVVVRQTSWVGADEVLGRYHAFLGRAARMNGVIVLTGDQCLPKTHERYVKGTVLQRPLSAATPLSPK